MRPYNLDELDSDLKQAFEQRDNLQKVINEIFNDVLGYANIPFDDKMAEEGQEILREVYEHPNYLLDYDNQRVIIGTANIPLIALPMSVIKDIYKENAETKEIRRETVAAIMNMTK